MSEHDHDDHKHGLEFDLEALARQRMGRRGLLALLGGSGVAALVGGFSNAATAQDELCVVDASETAGPYPGDGSNNAPGNTSNILAESSVVRSDIRKSFGTSTNAAAGIPLTLRIKLGDASNGCAACPATPSTSGTARPTENIRSTPRPTRTTSAVSRWSMPTAM